MAGVTGNIGGGGGAYSKTNAYVVIPGNTYNYVVGAGGAPNVGSAADTTFESVCIAKAGSTVAGGAASGGTGDVKFSGGNASSAATSTDGCGGGGGAGDGGNGGNAAGTTGGTGTATGGGNGGRGGDSTNDAVVGSTRGGGGGGGGGVVGHTAGKAGANGAIVLTYIASSRTSDSMIMNAS